LIFTDSPSFLWTKPHSFAVLIIAGILSSCSLIPQQSVNNCPTVEVVELPVTVPSCPQPKVIERIVTKTVTAPLPPMASTAGKLHLPIIGAVEWARVEPADLWVELRIDTGADTTSIHAEEIQLIEKDGKRYVSFFLIDAVTGRRHPQELRLRRRVLIKQSGGPDQRRYVVRMWVTVGEIRSRIDVNLTDRGDFEYPLLIGRNFLTDTMIVDVSRHHTMNSSATPTVTTRKSSTDD